MIDAMSDIPFSLPSMEPGWVWLVGAGPGDPGLLTLLAARALSQADVIVCDALVGNEILRLAGPHCVLEFMGKRAGEPSAKQDEISARLIELAKEGIRVLRLKGGDPFVFGRGADEALALAGAGVPFRVVPGITAGTGGLAYGGIPVTHGAMNATVTFLSGHGPSGDMPGNVDWRALAKSSPVIVLFMGLGRLGEIAEKLMDGGRNPAEPVAVVSRATRPDQSVLETTLGSAAADIEKAAPPRPAITVIGEVVRLRDRLDWLGRL